MPTATQLGQTGLQGWREKLADGIAEPVAGHVPLGNGAGARHAGSALLRALRDLHRQHGESRGRRGAIELRSPRGRGRIWEASCLSRLRHGPGPALH